MMKFSRRGAVLGFVGGASGGATTGLINRSFLLELAIATTTAIIVALLIGLIWRWRSG